MSTIESKFKPGDIVRDVDVFKDIKILRIYHNMSGHCVYAICSLDAPHEIYYLPEEDLQSYEPEKSNPN